MDQELDFLQYLEKSQLPYLNAISVLANAAGPGRGLILFPSIAREISPSGERCKTPNKRPISIKTHCFRLVLSRGRRGTKHPRRTGRENRRADHRSSEIRHTENHRYNQFFDGSRRTGCNEQRGSEARRPENRNQLEAQ